MKTSPLYCGVDKNSTNLCVFAKVDIIWPLYLYTYTLQKKPHPFDDITNFLLTQEPCSQEL